LSKIINPISKPNKKAKNQANVLCQKTGAVVKSSKGP